jgi:hypothetical protein
LPTPAHKIPVTLPEPACIVALASRGVLVPMLSDGVVAKIESTAPDRSLGAAKAVRHLVCTLAAVRELDTFFRKLADHFSLPGDNPIAAICIQAADNARHALEEAGMAG